MEGVTYGTPERFTIPEYDFAAVQTIARATNLESYYANLLDDAFDRSEEDFTYGMPPSLTKKLIERVRDGFEWKEWREKLQNMGEHYKVRISGIEDQGDINVHFVHRRSKKPNAINLLMVHGWPGSFLEFYKIIEILGDDYNIVLPSIPGYTFSEAPKKAAKRHGEAPWTYAKSSRCFNAIMQSLGYTSYVTQGGDWGAISTRCTAILFPDNVKALHLNYYHGSNPKPDFSTESGITDVERKGLDRMDDFYKKGSAYGEMQGTTPYTLGASLSCSPIATVIYIGSITSSFWLYYLRSSGPAGDFQRLEDTVVRQPVGFGCGAYEIHWPTRAGFEQQLPNVRQWNVLEKGGHFLALESPETLARDMNKMFQTNEVRKSLGIES